MRTPITVPGTVLTLIALLSGACSGDVEPYYRCTVRDGEGRAYVAKDANPVSAMEVARSSCALDARDPTSCVRGGCQPSR